MRLGNPERLLLAMTLLYDAQGRVLDARRTKADETWEPALRPTKLGEFTGQVPIVRQLAVMVAAARQREEVLDHLLFCGPPGLGKTTLAKLLAEEMGLTVLIHLASNPHMSVPSAVIDSQDNILFIDEIHALGKRNSEMLYSLMEDREIRMVGFSMTKLKPFTLLGATTQPGELLMPLRQRFGAEFRLSFYSAKELAAIVQRSAKLLDVGLEPRAARFLAERARGTPRIVNRLLRRCIDYMQVTKRKRVSLWVADLACRELGIDAHGLDRTDHYVLGLLVRTYRGGPIGLAVLASALGERSQSFQVNMEEYLVHQGWILRTARGRVATERAHKYFQEV